MTTKEKTPPMLPGHVPVSGRIGQTLVNTHNRVYSNNNNSNNIHWKSSDIKFSKMKKDGNKEKRRENQENDGENEDGDNDNDVDDDNAIWRQNNFDKLKFLRSSEDSGNKKYSRSKTNIAKFPSLSSDRKQYRTKSDLNHYDFITKNHLLHAGEFGKRALSRNSESAQVIRPDAMGLVESYFSKSERRLKHRSRTQYRDRRAAPLDDEMSEEGLDSFVELDATRSRSNTLESYQSRSRSNTLEQKGGRRNSLLRPRRRSSVFWVPPVYDNLSEEERQRRRKIRTFRWCAWIVKMLVGLLMHMQKLSSGKTQQSAYGEFLYILAGAKTHAGQEGHEEEGQHLLFDKSWFARTRAWSRMPVWAQKVMQLPPDERRMEDVQHLKQLLATMSSFRENVTDGMRTKMCQVVRYTKCDQGRVVFRQGHIGYDFYFIFSGSVFVQIEVYDEQTDETYTHVENVLKTGDGFGEIALLGDGKRTATVICKEPTELCQIDRATFLEVCPALFNEHLQEKIQFARQFPIFHNWQSESLKQLCFLSQVLDLPHSTVVETNWASSSFVYFVMKGRLSMLKEFDVTEIVDKTGQPKLRVLPQGPEVSHSTKQKHRQYAHVGTLGAGSCTELSLLSRKPPKDIAAITLVSEGVRLFRVAIRTFQRLSPRKYVEEYLRKMHAPRKFPTEEELCAHYLNNLNWTEFKKNLIHTHRLHMSGYVMASVPATLKGSSGWAKWPGYNVVPKIEKFPRSIQAVESANLPLDWNDQLSDDRIDDGEEIDDLDGGNAKVHRRDNDKEDVKRDDDHGMFQHQLVNDRSMSLIPATTKTMLTYRKNMPETADYKPCKHVFEGSVY